MNKKYIALTSLAAVVAVALGAGAAALYHNTQDSTPTDKPAAASSTAKKAIANSENTTDTDTAADSGYTNERYGFNAEYPEGWTAKPSQNGDGATFTGSGSDGTQIKAYGIPNSSLKPPDAIYTQLRGNIESTSEGFEELEKTSILLDEHPATQCVWRYRITAPGSTGAYSIRKMVFSLKGDAVVVLELTAPEDAYPNYVEAFDMMVREYKLK